MKTLLLTLMVLTVWQTGDPRRSTPLDVGKYEPQSGPCIRHRLEIFTVGQEKPVLSMALFSDDKSGMLYFPRPTIKAEIKEISFKCEEKQ